MNINLANYNDNITQFGLLDRIRFAAANHLCAELTYCKENGEQNVYIVEPYSLRQTPDGNILLYSLKHNTNDIRAFRTDRIINAKATNMSFIPKYRIELLPSASLNIDAH